MTAAAWLPAPTGDGWWWVREGDAAPQPVRVSFWQHPDIDGGAAHFNVHSNATDIEESDIEMRRRNADAQWLPLDPPATVAALTAERDALRDALIEYVRRCEMCDAPATAIVLTNRFGHASQEYACDGCARRHTKVRDLACADVIRALTVPHA